MRRATAAGVVAATLLAAALGSGCSTLGYYAQAAGGHLELMRKAQPVAEVEADPATPARLREQLKLSQRLRDFAITELKLPDNNSYRRYADLHRNAVVWNVVAAPVLSLTLKTSCFPVMGCVGYRGYFSQAAADALASELRGEGYEVDVYGVPAYSTLGWSRWLGGDPLLNTFIGWPEDDLARLIFHELAHQVAYASDDTTFNESFAVAVERIGSRLWLERQGTPESRANAERGQSRRADFKALTQRWRSRLEDLYASDLPEPAKLARKAEMMAALRQEYAELKTARWGGFAGYDAWMARANNATFGVQAVYDDLVPAFEHLFSQSGGDFSDFYTRVQALAALPKAQRRAKLDPAP
jgi:predicted aminopeptidase